MGRTKTLLKNTGVLMIGKISSQLINFLLLPLYTAKLTTAEYGEVDLYVSLLMIITPLITLQIEQGLFRYLIASKDLQSKRKIISSSFLVFLAMIVLYTVVFGLIGLITPMKDLAIVYSYYLSYAFFMIMLQVSRALVNNTLYSLASFLNTTMIILLSVAFVLGLGWKASGILMANVIGNVVISLYICIKSRIHQYIRFGKEYLSEIGVLLKYSVPLIFNQISSWVINYSDRVIILMFLGIGSNGIYSVSNKFFSVLISFFGVYNLAWTESVARSIDDHDNSTFVSDVVKYTFELYGIMTAWIIVGMSFMFPYLVNANYADAYHYIPILVIAAFFSGASATIGSIYIANKRTTSVAITTIGAGVVNIAVHFALIHFVGLYAAAISTLVSFAALLVYRIIGVRKFQKISINYISFGYTCLLMVAEWIIYIRANIIANVVGFIILSIYSIIFLRKNGKQIIQLVKR